MCVRPYGEPRRMWFALERYTAAALAAYPAMKSLSYVVILSPILWDGFLRSASAHARAHSTDATPNRVPNRPEHTPSRTNKPLGGAEGKHSALHGEVLEEFTSGHG